MRRTVPLLIVGVLAYLVGLAAAMPAERLRPLLAGPLPELRTGPLAGLAWRGHAAPVVYRGVPLDRVEWRWRPLALLLGRLALEVELSAGESHARLRVARSPWGPDFEIDDLDGELDLARLGRMLPDPPGRARGRLRLESVALDLDGGWPSDAAGRFALRDAVVTAPVRLEVGSLVGTLDSDDGRLRVAFASTPDNPVDGRGTLLVSADGGYRLSGELVPRDPSDAAARGLVRLAGRPGPDGKVTFDQSGRWR